MFFGIMGFEDVGIRVEVDVEWEWGNFYLSIVYVFWD